MRKLKFNNIAKKFIITALASSILTTCVGCSRNVAKENSNEQYNESKIEEKVDIEYNKSEIEEIVDIPEIEDIEVEEEKIEINAQVNIIEKLVISSEEDIQEALEYDKITYLKIENANISDFSFLKDINIELLQVINNENPIDVNCIDKDSIKQIYFYNVSLTNEDAILEFNNLENFIYKNPTTTKEINNLDFLRNCKELKNIEVENYAIENLDFAIDLKNLTSLSIIASSVEDITGIKECDNLSSLTISRGKVKDISCLKNLKNLSVVDLSDNYIEDVNLNNSRLCYLDLSENFIKNAEGIEKGEFLSAINLSKNQIKDFPEHLLMGEVSLDISYNNITNLSEEEKETIKNNSVSINLFDSLIDASTLKELYNSNKVYFQSDNVTFDIEQIVEYNAKMNKILSNINNTSITEEKIMQVTKYVCDNCSIDYSLGYTNKDNAYGALFEKAVCTGMTDLTNSLLRHLEIDNKEYHGDLNDITDNERHVWSSVKVGDKWYNCDAMQSKGKGSIKGFPQITLLSDKQLKEYGHIMDANNITENNTELDRDSIINNIRKDNEYIR